MARLPIPGSDKGTWGDVLNDFLGAAHNADGTLKAIDSSGVTGLAPVATSGSYADLTGTPTIPAVPVQSVAGKTGAVALTEDDIADLTTDLDNLQAAVNTATAGSINAASLSGRALSFSTVGGSNINAGNVVPNFTMGTVTTAVYTASAAAAIGGTAVDPTLSLTIPQGAPGDVTPASSSTGTTLTVASIPSTYTLTMNGNVTSISLPSPSNSIAATATLILIQDPTGGWTVTWPASVKWNEGVAPQPSSAANALSVFSLLWTGSLWIGFKSGQNFA